MWEAVKDLALLVGSPVRWTERVCTTSWCVARQAVCKQGISKEVPQCFQADEVYAFLSRASGTGHQEASGS